MTDLHAWLVQAIERVEAAAHAADDDLGWVRGQIEYSDKRVEADEAHIALHDPAAVLRRCAADRRILERHQPVHLDSWSHFGCAHDGKHAHACEPHLSGRSVCWPCPDVIDLADGYGWTGEAP